MSSAADQAIEAMRAVRDRLAGKVEKMGVEELTTGSGASEWTVTQVLSHLGNSAELMLASVDAAIERAPKPADALRQQVWDRWAALAPAEQAAGFQSATAAFLARLEALDSAARADLRIDLGFLPKPVDVATVVALAVSELTLHGWDVEIAFDSAATLAPEGLEAVASTAAMFLPYFAKADVIEYKPGRPVTVAVELTAPRKSFGLSLAQKVTLMDGAPSEVAAVFKGQSEAWLRLLSGRLRPEHTPDSVSMYGGGVSLDQLRAVFPGY